MEVLRFSPSHTSTPRHPPLYPQLWLVCLVSGFLSNIWAEGVPGSCEGRCHQNNEDRHQKRWTRLPRLQRPGGCSPASSESLLADAWCFVRRGVSARLVSRASAELGQGLRPVPASPAHTSGTLLHPLPPRHSERSGIRVDLYRLVTWPVTSESGRANSNVVATSEQSLKPSDRYWD